MPMSDKEQVQIFQSWLKQYGYYILFSVLTVIAVNIGWRYWHHYNHLHLEHATTTYEQMLSAIEKHKSDEAKLFGEKLINDYSSSPYASLAALTLAKEEVQAGKLKSAAARLQFVIKKSSSKILRQIARIRAARILTAMKQSKEALDLLTSVDDNSYEAEISEVVGDALMDLGKVQEAENAYRKAQRLGEDGIPQSPLLQVKLQQF